MPEKMQKGAIPGLDLVDMRVCDMACKRIRVLPKH